MRTASLGEVASINPRETQPPPPDTEIAFTPLAALDAQSAVAGPGTVRPYAEVQKGYTVFRDQDLLVAKITPSFENGKIGQAVLSRQIGVGSTEFHVVRADVQRADPRYLLHFLRQAWIRVEGERRMTGSAGQRRVPASYLASLRVPLPEIPRQRRIAAILDQADALRAKRRQSLALLRDLERSAFDAEFTDARTTTTRSLGQLAEIASGLTKGRKLGPQVTRSVPYLAVANVQDGHLKLETVKEIEATEGEIERYRLLPGDIVMTEGGDPDKLGRGTIWRGELPLCLHQNHIFRVRLHSGGEVESPYLAAYIAGGAARSYFLRSAKQTTGIASINMTQLRGLPVAVPSLASQRRFISHLEHIRQVTARLHGAAHEADALFTSLQSRAFSGELTLSAS